MAREALGSLLLLEFLDVCLRRSRAVSWGDPITSTRKYLSDGTSVIARHDIDVMVLLRGACDESVPLLPAG